MLPLERSSLQQVTRRVNVAVQISLELSHKPSVISELCDSIDLIAPHLKSDDSSETHIIVGGRSAPLTLALLDSCFFRAGFHNTKIAILDSLENKELYEGKSYAQNRLCDREYIIPEMISNIAKEDAIHYVDDRVRTGEKASHVKKALAKFGFQRIRFLTFASALSHPDVITGTINRDLYALLDNLSYLYSRRSLLLKEGRIVQDGTYFDIESKDIPAELLMDLNTTDIILSILQSSIRGSKDE